MRFLNSWKDRSGLMRQKRLLARQLREANDEIAELKARLNVVSDRSVGDRTVLLKKIADLEERLQIESSTVRVQEMEIRHLVAVCARDRERVRAEQAMLGAQQTPPSPLEQESAEVVEFNRQGRRA